MTKSKGENALHKGKPKSNINEPFQSTDIATIALDSANVGIWIIDPKSRKFLPSTRTKELFGFLLEDEMSFENAILQVVDKYRKDVLEAIENAFNNHSNLYIEFPVICLYNKKHRWLNITGGFSSTDVNGYLSGIVMDITEQKQNDLRRIKFIGMVSHELKT